jgi:hypothetical protein
MGPEPGDDVGIDDERREGRRRLQAAEQRAQGADQRGPAAGIGVQRPLGDEVDHGHPRRLVDMVDAGRDAGCRRDGHRLVLPGIAQRAGRALDPDQVAAPATSARKG